MPIGQGQRLFGTKSGEAQAAPAAPTPSALSLIWEGAISSVSEDKELPLIHEL